MVIRWVQVEYWAYDSIRMNVGMLESEELLIIPLPLYLVFCLATNARQWCLPSTREPENKGVSGVGV
jgi:hypothetical protein